MKFEQWVRESTATILGELVALGEVRLDADESGERVVVTLTPPNDHRQGLPPAITCRDKDAHTALAMVMASADYDRKGF